MLPSVSELFTNINLKSFYFSIIESFQLKKCSIESVNFLSTCILKARFKCGVGTRVQMEFVLFHLSELKGLSCSITDLATASVAAFVKSCGCSVTTSAFPKGLPACLLAYL